MAAPRNKDLAKKWRARIRRTKPACHICGQPINYEAEWLDPNSFVIDHVIPLAKGGEDAWHNVRAAHRACNSKKRARVVAPIIRRSGSLG
jgi:5-methylcytosine-specific restriction endonuclease McrA